jgi:hypothetical protein
MRDEQFVWSDAKTYDGQYNNPGPSKPRNKGHQFQGNARGQSRPFRGGGRPNFRGQGPKSGRGGQNKKNNQPWSDSGHEQSNPSNQNNNRGQLKGNKRPWGGGRGGKQ